METTQDIKMENLLCYSGDFWNTTEWNTTAPFPEPYLPAAGEYTDTSLMQAAGQYVPAEFDLTEQILFWEEQKTSQLLQQWSNWHGPGVLVQDAHQGALNDAGNNNPIINPTSSPKIYSNSPSSPAELKPGSEIHKTSPVGVSSESKFRLPRRRDCSAAGQRRRNSRRSLDSSMAPKKGSQVNVAETLENKFRNAREELSAMAAHLDCANKKQQMMVEATYTLWDAEIR